MCFVTEMKAKVIKGEWIDRQEALQLAREPLVKLQEAADLYDCQRQVRQMF